MWLLCCSAHGESAQRVRRRGDRGKKCSPVTTTQDCKQGHNAAQAGRRRGRRDGREREVVKGWLVSERRLASRVSGLLQGWGPGVARYTRVGEWQPKTRGRAMQSRRTEGCTAARDVWMCRLEQRMRDAEEKRAAADRDGLLETLRKESRLPQSCPLRPSKETAPEPSLARPRRCARLLHVAPSPCPAHLFHHSLIMFPTRQHISRQSTL